jgi:hypothetical protein
MVALRVVSDDEHNPGVGRDLSIGGPGSAPDPGPSAPSGGSFDEEQVSSVHKDIAFHESKRAHFPYGFSADKPTS